MVDSKLLAILACPQCKGSLTPQGAEPHHGADLVCPVCRLSYPSQNGVPVLMVEEARPLTSPVDLSGETQMFEDLPAGPKVTFRIVEGQNKGEVIEIEKGTCRALGRSLDDKEKTRVFSVDSNIGLDDFSKKLVMNFISKQFGKSATAGAFGAEALGSFRRKADFPVRDASVSRLHAMLFYDASGVGILDLVSKNGTFVNGVEVESKPLKPGDLVMVGSTKMRLE